MAVRVVRQKVAWPCEDAAVDVHPVRGGLVELVIRDARGERVAVVLEPEDAEGLFNAGLWACKTAARLPQDGPLRGQVSPMDLRALRLAATGWNREGDDE